MKNYVYLALFAALLCVWIFGLWRQGLFAPRTPRVDRHAFYARALLWATSILILSWPLQRYRAEIGDTAYVLASAGTLILFFSLGRLATHLMFKHAGARRDVA